LGDVAFRPAERDPAFIADILLVFGLAARVFFLSFAVDVPPPPLPRAAEDCDDAISEALYSYP
jgi:hypothetical protein